VITVFNRKELLLTHDMQKQGDVRAVLQNSKIAYRVKVTNRHSPSPFSGVPRSRTGTLGVDLGRAYEYKIYVRKSDYEKAKYLLNTWIKRKAKEG